MVSVSRVHRATAFFLSVIMAAMPPAVGIAQSAQSGSPVVSNAASLRLPSALPVQVPINVNRAKPEVAAPNDLPVFSDEPTEREISMARIFSEPIVAVGEAPAEAAKLVSEAAERKALASALNQYVHRQRNEQVDALEQFATNYPQSRWTSGVRINVAVVHRLTGRFTRALAQLETAWAALREDKSAIGSLLGDLALAELAELNARFGRQERLRALFAESVDRNLRGSARERFVRAKEGLWNMENAPEAAFLCGPYAVTALCRLQNPKFEYPSKHPHAKSTAQGTSLEQMLALATDSGLKMQLARRNPGAALITPAVVHWKVGHFAALLRHEDGRALVHDRTWRYDHWIEDASLDEEGSGYFLVPAGPLPEGWFRVSQLESSLIWGKGDVGGANPDDLSTDDEKMKDDCPNVGLPGYNIHALNISLNITDTPVGYSPPYGPAVYFQLGYLQREANQPLTFNYGNVGRKWTHNWLAYLKDDPGNEADDVYLVAAGGGQQRYSGYDAASATYGLQYKNGTKLKRVSVAPIRYERLFPDGSKETYGQPDAQTSFPRRVFLTKRADAFGNEISFQYDALFRLVSVTDALGQVTTVDHGDPADPLRITKVTDPFGRFAAFEYNADGLLKKITDVQGISAEFTYRAGDFLTEMTTGYGTTRFDGGEDSGRMRWLEITDPLGQKERAEFVHTLQSPGHGPGGSGLVGISTTDADFVEAFLEKASPSAPSPQPTSDFNRDYLQYRNSFFWDKKAMAEAPGLYAKAHIYHWVHRNSSGSGPTNIAGNLLESQKAPLTGRVWYRYPGQVSSIYFEGTTLARPIKIARIVESSTSTPSAPVYTTELTQIAYNDYGNVTQVTDPKGRVTTYTYAANEQDLLNVKQKVNATGYHTVAVFTYSGNYPHLPMTSKDPSGNTTTYAYNASGQIKTIDDPVNPIVTFNYETASGGYLTSVDGALAGTTDVVSVTYDSKRNVRTITQPDGYVVTFDTDNLDRVTKVTFPDGTYQETLYDLLNVAWSRDRMGRWTRIWHNRLKQTVAVTDPLNRTTQLDWCACGSLRALSDPEGRKTMWFRDIAGRPTKKLYEDPATPANQAKSVELYSYQPYSGRSDFYTDPDGRQTQLKYNVDGTVAEVTYPGSTVTPTVSYIYDDYWPRIKSMTDGTGTTTYTFRPISTTSTADGEGMLQTIVSPVGSDTLPINFTYDALNRVTTTDINTRDIVNTFDALGRLTKQVNLLGRFDYTYVGATGRLDHVDYRTSASATTFKTINAFTYDSMVNDFRLLSIDNKNLAATPATVSRFDYTYRPDGMIQTWKQNQTALGAAKQWTFGYDAADQLTSGIRRDFGTQALEKISAFGYDRSGNRIMEQQDGVVGTAAFNRYNQLTATSGIATTANVLVSGQTINPQTGTGEVTSVTVNNQPAAVFGDGSFQAWVTATSGANSVPITATDGSGNATPKTLSFTLSDGTPRTCTYDLTGNLLSDGERTYTWDAAGRLLTVTKNGVTTEFVYDGLSRRVAEKTNGTVTKRWTYVGMTPCEERNAAGTTVTKRYFAQGFEMGTTAYFTTHDHLGSVREVFDASGVTKAAYSYDLWGKRSANAITSAPVESDFGFTGHYEHTATGLVLAPYRAYEPVAGQWTSRDPIGESGGVNLYQYCAGDPINFVDLTGAAPRPPDVLKIGLYDGADPGGTSPIGRIANRTDFKKGAYESSDRVIDISRPGWKDEYSSLVKNYENYSKIIVQIYDHGTEGGLQEFGNSVLLPGSDMWKFLYSQGRIHMFDFYGCEVAKNEYGDESDQLLESMAKEAQAYIRASTSKYMYEPNQVNPKIPYPAVPGSLVVYPKQK